MFGFYLHRKDRRAYNTAADFSAPQSGMDAEGYIVSQSAFQPLYYGARGTQKAGCGPVCCYNILRHFDKTESFGGILEWFEKRELAGGDLGASVYNVIAFLRKRSLSCRVSCFSKQLPPEFLHAGALAVFYYGRVRGRLPYAHFICMLAQREDGAFKRDGAGRPLFLLYNGSPTRKNAEGEYLPLLTTFEGYFKNRRFPAFVIAVDEADRVGP